MSPSCSQKARPSAARWGDGGGLGIPFDNSLASVILLSQTIEQRRIGDQSRDEDRQDVTISRPAGLD